MAKRGRPRKVKNDKNKPSGGSPITEKSLMGLPTGQPTVVPETLKVIGDPLMGLKITFNGKLAPDFVFRGEITGAILNPMRLTAQIIKAYKLYILEKKKRIEKDEPLGEIFISGSQIGKVSM